MKIQKKYIIFIILILFSMILYQFRKESIFNEGIYTGTGDGYTSEIILKVETDSRKILEIEVVSENENPEIGNIVYPLLIADAKTNNGENIDVITGATLTSQGFIDALKEALSKAKGLKE